MTFHSENPLLLQLNRLFQNQFIKHLSYWVGVVVTFTCLWGSYQGRYDLAFRTEIAYLPARFIIVYTVILLLVPKLLFKGKLWQFVISMMLIVSVGGILLLATEEFIIVRLLKDTYFSKPKWFDILVFVKSVINITFVLVIPLIVKLFAQWLDTYREAQAFEREKLENELKFLKGQVTPHFLFNTLNSIYSLALKKSDQTPDIILKLSDLMRYLMNCSSLSKVKVEEEVKFIKNYVDLEKLRLGNRCTVHLTVNGNSPTAFIEPMILLPFVENTFKHSVHKVYSGAFIDLEISYNNNELLLTTKNSKVEEDTSQNSGTGLRVVRRRLDINYKDNYLLEINENDNIFEVELKIILSNNQGV